MIPSRSLRRWVVGMATAIVTCTLPGVGSAVTVSAAKGVAAAEPHATGTVATTTTLYLCAGPTPSCPATGFVMPPYSAAFSMSYGQDWNGTAVVEASDGLPLPGQTVITWSLNGGPAQVICTLPTQTGGTCPASVGTTQGTSLGVNTITASYTGDATHAPSSSTVVITVVEDTTTASLVGSPNPAQAGQPVTLTATMTGSNAAPTGMVTFAYGGAVIGTGTLAAGTGLSSTATMTTSTLPAGQDTITATYAGTQDFAGASATFTETITPSLAGSFTLSVTPNPVTIGVGYGTLLAVTVTPMDGFAQDVNLTCGNLAPEMTCAFVNPTIAGGSGTTTLIVQTAAPHSCGATAPYFLGENGGGLGRRGAPITLATVAGLFAFALPRGSYVRRRWVKLLLALAAVFGAMGMSGCGNCTDLGTRPATYSIEVTGTAAAAPSGSPAATASQAVTVNVTI